jgi:bile acid-coenzyme A ligase
MTAKAKTPISFGARIAQLSAKHPRKIAIVLVSANGAEKKTSWRELDCDSNRMARLLASRAVKERSLVVVALPNCMEHLLMTIGAWKLGACVLPLKYDLPPRERDQFLEVAQPAAIVGNWDIPGATVLHVDEFEQARALSDAPLPDRVAQPGKLIASGGSTGRPKIIVDPNPWAKVPGQFITKIAHYVGMRSGQTQIVAGPLYHNGAFNWSHAGLFEDHSLVVMERFDARLFVDLVERHRVNFGLIVPTMMKRIAELPGVRRGAFSSVQAFFHTAAPCPERVKRAWIDLIGPTKLYEAFGATEGVGLTSIRGDEWLKHPGSVGQPRNTDLRILDESGHEAPTGQIGEIFMRPKFASGRTFEYLNAPTAKTTPDGLVSVGDFGWVDEQGYLFPADRRVDMIISGGSNVYPAEVEGALAEHSNVRDVAVIGLPDEEWGQRVHAIIELADPAKRPSAEEMKTYCKDRIASYKVPKSFEFVTALPRDEAGKLRRTALVEERAHSIQ